MVIVLQNAIKAIKDEPVKLIHVEVLKSVGAPEVLKIEISDTGCGGVTPAIAKTVFSSEFTSYWSNDINSGVGIGLYLCRKVLQLFNASIFISQSQCRPYNTTTRIEFRDV